MNFSNLENVKIFHENKNVDNNIFPIVFDFLINGFVTAHFCFRIFTMLVYNYNSDKRFLPC